jgi:hypothetical protein
MSIICYSAANISNFREEISKKGEKCNTLIQKVTFYIAKSKFWVCGEQVVGMRKVAFR